MIDLKKYTFIVFILLFPADILFYLLEIIGYIDFPVGIISYILSLPLILLFLYEIFDFKMSLSTWTFLFIFFAFLILSVIPIATSTKSDAGDYVLVMKYFLYFIIGFYLYNLLEVIKFRKILTNITIFVSLLIIVFYTNVNVQLYVEDHLNYLRLSESLVFLSVIAIVTATKKIYKHIIFIICLSALFYLGSRSALFGFLILYTIYLVIEYGIRDFIITTAKMVIILAPFILFISEFWELLIKNRVFFLVLNTDADSSLMERSNLLLLGISRIINNPLLGDFKGQLAYGEYGAYIHNIFSYWSQFGIFSFLLIIILIIISISFLVHQFRRNRIDNHPFKLVLVYFLYCLLQVAVSKSFVYMNLFISLGMIFSMMKTNLQLPDLVQNRFHLNIGTE